MKNLLREHWAVYVSVILLYATAMLYQGYTYGTGDQSQILPVLWAEDHPEAYPHDHYVQAYRQAELNERTVFHFLWQWLGYADPWVTLGWHALSTMALMLAWMRISGLFLQRLFYQSLVTGILVTVAVHVSAGGNELYYPSLIPSLPAKALASWGLYYWLTARYRIWTALLMAAGLLQPLVGIQVFLLTGLTSGVAAVVTRNRDPFPWREALLFLIPMTVWTYLLARHNGVAGAPETFMEILEFRLSHHFFPGSFPIRSILVSVLLAVLAMVSLRGKIKFVLILIIAGCIAYTVGIHVFRSPGVAYTQWFKTTIWLEAFALIGLGRILEKFTYYNRFFTRAGVLAAAMWLLLVGGYRMTGWFGAKPDYHIPGQAPTHAEIRISQTASQVTPADAVFVVPHDFTAFRWYSKRSLYVDYKALFHQQAFLESWYARIQEIYQFNLADRKAGFDFATFAEGMLREPPPEILSRWRQLGITHFISPADTLDQVRQLAAVPPYYLYEIPTP